ncbi:hypothetical protein [Cedecea sp. NFIX57]|uniref:hypothetical protein n=1 Tax=Cedecea sp. NFIX57 TaxID=1566286 RepID=UPI000A0E7330|nr:hypothetical protein [Cedecea sp. NFIX57]SMG62051.1 hypothetical protein SAMN03159353_11113 [Cedecea sp. NFIX57]
MVAMAGVQGAKAGVVATQQASEAGEDAGRYPAQRIAMSASRRQLLRRTAGGAGGQQPVREVVNIDNAYSLGMAGEAYEAGRYSYAAETEGGHLYVIAHGEEGGVELNNEILNAQQFHDHLRNVVGDPPNEYQQITLAICHSADGGEQSLGYQLSKIIGPQTRVRAFFGEVITERRIFDNLLRAPFTIASLDSQIMPLMEGQSDLLNFTLEYRPNQLKTW